MQQEDVEAIRADLDAVHPALIRQPPPGTTWLARDGFEEMMGVHPHVPPPHVEVTQRGAELVYYTPAALAAEIATGQNARMLRMRNLDNIVWELTRTADRLTNISHYVVALAERVREVVNAEGREGHYDETISPESEVLPPPSPPQQNLGQLDRLEEIQPPPPTCRETQREVRGGPPASRALRLAPDPQIDAGDAARRSYERTAEAAQHLQALMTTEMWQQQLQGISQPQENSVSNHCLRGLHRSPALIAGQQQARQHLPESGSPQPTREQTDEDLENTVERFQ